MILNGCARLFEAGTLRVWDLGLGLAFGCRGGSLRGFGATLAIGSDVARTLLVVSHDADFLDSVCTDVLHLEAGGL